MKTEKLRPSRSTPQLAACCGGDYEMENNKIINFMECCRCLDVHGACVHLAWEGVADTQIYVQVCSSC